MENNDATPLTYQDYLKLHASFTTQSIQPLLDEAAGGDEIDINLQKAIEESKKESTQQKDPGEQSISLLHDLCRICGNKGNISLYTGVPATMTSFKPSRESKKQNPQISQMIAQISGVKIDPNDKLPQFICMHCLGYLQHTYNMHCQIIEANKNFLAIQQLETQEGSIPVDISPSSAIPTISENQKEIFEEKADIESEIYWNEVITKKTTKITIAVPSTSKRIESLREYKCPGCERRIYSIEALNRHTSICIISQLKTFFSQFQLLFKAFSEKSLSSLSYQMQALSLIYNSNKTLRKITKRNKIDLRSLSTEVSTNDANRTYTDASARRQRDQFYSPDFGYNSNT